MRTITTHEELDALPDGTVVRSAQGSVFEKDGGKWCRRKLYETDPAPFLGQWHELEKSTLLHYQDLTRAVLEAALGGGEK